MAQTPAEIIRRISTRFRQEYYTWTVTTFVVGICCLLFGLINGYIIGRYLCK